jgi:hypothetical protein
MIFINADADDLELAKKLQNKFEKQEMAAVLPKWTGAAAELRTHLEENYLDCDGVVFVYGSTPPSWVRGQMRLFDKVKGRREKPPRAIAVLIAPPSTSRISERDTLVRPKSCSTKIFQRNCWNSFRRNR